MISALAVMIAVAGYLNYSGRLFGDKVPSADEKNASQELLDISQEETADIDSLDDDIVVGIITGTSRYIHNDEVLRRADVDSDGEIDSSDKVRISRKASGGDIVLSCRGE
jgi:hypothetical protein